jgi:hypothetical protein
MGSARLDIAGASLVKSSLAKKWLGVFYLAGCAALLTASVSPKSANTLTQQSYPDPPNDATRVYYLSADKTLRALPFEPGITPFNLFLPAEKDRITRVNVGSSKATTVLASDNLSFYVFVADRMDPPPHQLVHLTSRKDSRQLTISLVKGRKGYAPFESDNVSLSRRLLERLRVDAGRNRYLFVNYMELRPLTPLAPGEYAIIGDSLADMATFRIQ